MISRTVLIRSLFIALLFAWCAGRPPAFAANPAAFEVGVAKIDITPSYPIRLSGYAVRKTEAPGAAQHLFAKALAIGRDKDPGGPALLITVDNTGVPATVRNQVVQRLQKQNKQLQSDHVALCSSHSHTAPCLAGNLPTLFGEDIPPEHQAHIERYTRELVEALEQVSLEALKNRRPAKLAWGQGSAGFAANRRTKGGPTDHDLPVLVVTDPKNSLRAIVVNYACHCTTLGGDTNLVCGDWAGYAQEFLEQDHPGAIVMTAIGCAADANPQPRGNLDLAKQHGHAIEAGVNEVLGRTLGPLTGKLDCRALPIELPFDTIPTRAQWEKTATQKDYAGYHARVNLAKLDRGETIPTKLPYLVQSWNFGNDLAMVFLPGEVVVDYSKRLKKEFDAARLWVNAYANDVPCYIPSERILTEGGYEGGGAMIFYDKPARLAPGIENLIVGAVHQVVPESFVSDEHKAEFPPPKSPAESLAAIQTHANYTVELVASEPLIVDPVAIDWGPDGKLWVVEMRDYPAGMDGHWKPGSRIKYLEDTNGDGKYDKATVFLDNLPFATGVTAWRRGVLVCAAPDVIYAEDTKRDGHPDIVKKLFTGFYTDNYQARVNSLSLGLDNWIYGANGLLGGVIRGESRPVGQSTAKPIEVDIRGRDFRINPDTGAFEPASGLTQQGRVRDDWGNWFGCDNSTIAWHYPLPDHYLHRNPYVKAPSPRVSVARGDDPNLLHPISRTLERFNDPGSANRVTSGCGMGIYRDDLLGSDLYGNEFTCEPVHNLVHRLVLKSNDIAITGDRAAGEQNSEFLASRDNWFRPVQVRTGPDGAFYVVDMYRFVIEHPRWITADRLAKLDVRAGADKGRIYRVVPKSGKLRPVPDLTKLSASKLAALLDTPNGTERDRVHQELICRGDQSAGPRLEELAARSKSAAVRLQALCVLDGLQPLKPELLALALADPEPAVRANAIRLCEPGATRASAIGAAPAAAPKNRAEAWPKVLALVDDPSPVVRFQLALSLGEWNDTRAGVALGSLAKRDLEDSWMRAAILSSAVPHSAEILNALLTLDAGRIGRSEMIASLIATAAGAGNPDALAKVIGIIAPNNSQRQEPWQLSALTSLLDALDRKNLSLASLARSGDPGLRDLSTRLAPMIDRARVVAADADSPDALREQSIRLLGRDPEHQDADLALLAKLLTGPLSVPCEQAAFDGLKRVHSPEVPKLLLANWNLRPPSQRQQCVAVLLAREDWIRNLVEALNSGTVGSNEIAPADRQRLLKHPDQSVRDAARALWKTNPSRAEVLAKYKDATTLPGDASKGATLFANTCASCHFLRGQGHNVGPNLAPLADKTPGDLLTAILDPNAAVEPRFIAYNIDTRDGRSLSGIVSAETATTLTLVQGGGVQEQILRSEIQQIRASGLSLMPEGLEQTNSIQDFADLIAYLKSSPRAFGSATPEQAAEAKKNFLRSGMNGFHHLISKFDQLPYASWIGTQPMAYARQTDGHAKVTWQTAPVSSSLKPGDFVQFRLAAAMGLISDASGKFTLTVNGKAPLDFDVALTDQSWQTSDGSLRLKYTVLENNSEDSNGILVVETAASLLEPGQPATIEVTGSAANSQRWFGIYVVEL